MRRPPRAGVEYVHTLRSALCSDELKALFRVDPAVQCDTHNTIKCT